jgi:hypothetical protein
MPQKTFLCWILAGTFLSEVETYASLPGLIQLKVPLIFSVKIKLLSAFNSIKDKNMQDICLSGLIICINFRGWNTIFFYI